MCFRGGGGGDIGDYGAGDDCGVEGGLYGSLALKRGRDGN